MINEIKNFVEHISKNDKDVFARNLQLKEGIYILLDIEKQGEEFVLLNEKEIFDTKEDILVYDEKSEVENKELYNLFLSRYANSQVVGTGSNKSFNSSSGIFMFTATAFGTSIKKKSFYEKQDGKEKERFSYNETNDSYDVDKVVKISLSSYFKSARKYVKEQKHIDYLDVFQDFSERDDRLLNLILSLEEFKGLKKDGIIFLFLKEPSINDFAEVNGNYIAEKVFIEALEPPEKKQKPSNILLNDTFYGLIQALNSGNMDKKVFRQHQTAPFEFSYRVQGDIAKKIWQFFELYAQDALPNPTPIFIDKEELNTEMIKIFEDGDKKIGHAKIIERILSKPERKELQNYYLLYHQKGKGIVDIDFIPLFKYEEKDAQIIEVFNLGGSQENRKIENVFDLENFVFVKIFDDILIRFGELFYFFPFFDQQNKKASGIRKELVKKGKIENLKIFMVYRQSIYDFIYKSKRHAITSLMFDDMLRQGILDDIRHDENYSKEYAIKEKLNIWFSLYNFFINTNQLNRDNMVNETQELLLKLRELTESDEHVQDDKAFAFIIGQVVHILLNKSKTESKTHSLLEPFLQKTDVNQLKLAIARTFDNYKHDIPFYWKGFDKLMSEIMGYVPDEKNMKNLLPFILAGYFAKSVFSKDKSETTN